jgi:hypothetical protein
MQNEKLKELQSTTESFNRQFPETLIIQSPIIQSGVFKGSLIKSVPGSHNHSVPSKNYKNENKVEVLTMLPSIPVKL